VLRHAKAASQGRDDHSRPLTTRGTRQATDVGTYLAHASIAGAAAPALVLSSSARRARQTAELAMAQLDPHTPLLVERGLYHADADDVIEILRERGGDAPSILVVGHNPTLHDLALLLVGDDDDEGRTRLERGFPTAALAVLGLGSPTWARLSARTATLLELRTPGR